MIIDHFNLNQMRVFESVFRTRSMTQASHELHLTQSGVSQHIKSLEEGLGVRLFDRVRQKLVPTQAGSLLFKRCSQSLLELEEALTLIKGGEKRLSGTVSIGMPLEFGHNVVIPHLCKFAKKHPQVKFRFEMGFVSTLTDKVLTGDLDFALVDDFNLDRRITAERVYDEILDLCVSVDFLKSFGPARNTAKYFEALPYVDYQEGAPVARSWLKHHLGTSRMDLNVVATVMDVQGVARMILNEVGAGVLPHHLTVRLQREGHQLHQFKGCGKSLKNTIKVAYLRERSHTLAAKTSLQWLKESLELLAQ